MCNSYCISFVEKLVSGEDVEGKDVLELGACDVNGTVRPYLESLRPGSYVGVDIMPGSCVDVICDAAHLLNRFQPASFDLVVTTEMLEHVRDWRRVIHNMKRVVKPGGLIVITTRSRGFPLHDHPGDFWRYEPDDMRAIFADCDLLKMERDEADPGIFVVVRTPDDPAWEPLDLSGWALWSVRSDTRSLEAEGEPPVPVASVDDVNRVLQVVNALQQDLAALQEDRDRQSVEAQALIAAERTETAKRAAEAEVARLNAELKAVYASRTFRWTLAARRRYARIRQLLQNSDQSTTAMREIKRGEQASVEPSEAEKYAIRIAITRGDMEWTITPDIFEEFSFQDGDHLEVTPSETAAQLPNTWGDTHILVRPGAAIRVPAIYKIFEFKGFEIPAHLVTLTGAGPETFDLIGHAHIERFQEHVGLDSDMRILDIGCGIGRDAFQLLDFLSPKGEFIGTDVIRDSIIWCQTNITRRYRNFRFYHFDMENELYNPYGTKTSMDFTLPVEDGSVDRIILSSVFTHLLESEVLHYMREIRRALKPNGLTYASFFHLGPEVLDAAKTRRNTEWQATFDVPLGDGVFANDPEFPRGAVGFTDEAAKRVIAQAGLRLDRPFLKGWWSGYYGDAAQDGQDVMILRV